MAEEAENLPSPSSSQLSVGSYIDGHKYQLLELLGKGSFGTVYKARHVLLEQLCAIKFFDKQYFLSEHSVARFQKEAVLLSSFSHPNIVKFQAFGSTAAGQQFMVLEYLEGQTIAELLAKEGALDQSRALPIFLNVCRALSYVHQRNILHRDLKSANIMICKTDDANAVKILDFGIYKDLSDEGLNSTRTGAIVGSANYMSPEQCKSGTLDKRSDIYSLGCVMYESLVGQAPMQADNELLIMSNHLNKNISEVPARFPISPELAKIILRCLCKDPILRYDSVAQLESELLAVHLKPSARRKKIRYLKAISLIVLPIALCLICVFLSLGLKKNSQELVQMKAPRQKNRELPEFGTDLLRNYENAENWLSKLDEERASKESQPDSLKAAIADEPFIQELVNGIHEVELARRQVQMLNPDGSALIKRMEDYLCNAYYKKHAFQSKIYEEWRAKIKISIAPIELARGRALAAEELVRSIAKTDQESINQKQMALIMMSNLASADGHFEKACEYANQAHQICKNGEDDNRVDALCELGSAEQLEGSEQGCQDHLKAALKLAIDYHDRRLRDDRVLKAVRALNDFGCHDQVIEFLEKHYVVVEPRKFRLHVVCIRRELARAYLAKGRKKDALKVLADTLAECEEKAPSYEFSDLIEIAYLRALHQNGLDSQIMGQGAKYLDKLKAKNESRYLRAVAPILSVLTDLGVDTKEAWQKADRTIVELSQTLEPSHQTSSLIVKGDQALVVDLAELLYNEGVACINRGEAAEATICFDRAEQKLAPLMMQSALRPANLRLAIVIRRYQILAQMGDNVGAKSIGKKLHTFEDFSFQALRTFQFETIRKNLGVDLLKSTDVAANALRTQLNASAMTSNHLPDFALFVAEQYSRLGKPEQAVSILRDTLTSMFKYRRRQYPLESKLLLTRLKPLYQSLHDTAELEHCDVELIGFQSAIKLLGPEDLADEPSRTWTR